MSALRKWITPLTIGSFVLMAATGVLMFFHKDTGVNKLAHQWLSWLFVAAVGLHAATHWTSFQRYFQSAKGLTVIGGLVAVLGLSFYPWQGIKPEPPARAVMKSLGRTPLADLAPVVHATPDELMARLKAKGFTVASAGQTPADIGGGGKKADAVLGAIFAQQAAIPPRSGARPRSAP